MSWYSAWTLCHFIPPLLNSHDLNHCMQAYITETVCSRKSFLPYLLRVSNIGYSNTRDENTCVWRKLCCMNTTSIFANFASPSAYKEQKEYIYNTYVKMGCEVHILFPLTSESKSTDLSTEPYGPQQQADCNIIIRYCAPCFCSFTEKIQYFVQRFVWKNCREETG
jgi:hypothetical protein